MPSTPYAKLLYTVDGGALQSSSATVAGGSVIQFSGESTVGWTQQLWELYGYPIGFPTPSGWTLAANGTLYSTSVLPSAITLSAAATRWGKYMSRLIVNGGSKNGLSDDTMTDAATSLRVLSPNGQLDLGSRESTQFSVDWTVDFRANLRILETLANGVIRLPSEISLLSGIFQTSATASGTPDARVGGRYLDLSPYTATMANGLVRVVKFITNIETTGGTLTVRLYNVTDSEAVGIAQTTTGTTSTQLSSTLTVGSSSGNLKTGKTYALQAWISAAAGFETITITNARLVITYE